MRTSQIPMMTLLDCFHRDLKAFILIQNKTCQADIPVISLNRTSPLRTPYRDQPIPSIQVTLQLWTHKVNLRLTSLLTFPATCWVERNKDRREKEVRREREREDKTHACLVSNLLVFKERPYRLVLLSENVLKSGSWKRCHRHQSFICHLPVLRS